jgi:hypothetical protein
METRKKNQGRVFPIILGQCSVAMRDQVESNSKWEDINIKTDVIGLLKLIQDNSNVKQPRRAYTHHMLDAQTEFLTFKQGTLSIPNYLKSFKDRLEQLERLSGPVGQELTRVNTYLKDDQPFQLLQSVLERLKIVWNAEGPLLESEKLLLRIDHIVGECSPGLLHIGIRLNQL